MMSYADGLPAITAALTGLLSTRLRPRGVEVTALAPDLVATAGSERPRLNVFLYHVSNEERLNSVLRREAGAAQSAVLDLQYLLTAYGAAESESESVIGSAMQILHEHPVLMRHATPQGVKWAEQLERIEITAANLSIELLASLWTAFRMPYRTSVAYQVRATLTASAAK